MRVFYAVLFLALCSASATKREVLPWYRSLDSVYLDTWTCSEYPNLIDLYRHSLYNFTIETYKHAAFRGNYHFVVSPHSMWITLAGVAEGADPPNQQQLLRLLSLPDDPCLRQKYYELATSRFSFTSDVSVVSTRTLVIDEGVTLNPEWHSFVSKYCLLDVVSVPIKYNPLVAATRIRQLVSAHFPKLNLRGNSVLLDTMDYNGLWTTAFSDAVVKRAPFYNQTGQQIGSVDLMTVKRRGKIGYVPTLQAKILELPIGTNGQYSMIMALLVGSADLRPIVRDLNSSIIPELLASLKDSVGPIDVALPRFTMNSELDAKTILQDLGIKNLWTNPEATRCISYPPAFPSSYIQRATVTLNNDGINPAPPSQLRSYFPSPKDHFWSEFIADKPFMFGIFDTATYTCLLASMFTQPTYPIKYTKLFEL